MQHLSLKSTTRSLHIDRNADITASDGVWWCAGQCSLSSLVILSFFAARACGVSRAF